MFGWLRDRRRRELRQTPLSEEWWAIIARRVPIVARMDAADRDELGGIVQILLNEKHFEGCGGLELTDEICVTIAAQAAVLLLHRDTDYYPDLVSILVYPRSYVSTEPRLNADGTVTESPQGRQGESWTRGTLVLSWDNVVRGAANDGDGQNVVFHEFAHQLDGEASGIDGAPDLPSAARSRAWAAVLSEEYAELVGQLHEGSRTVLDAYGATNPAEFFAVATELFFERPRAMRKSYPEMYAQFCAFYSQDPASWRPGQ